MASEEKNNVQLLYEGAIKLLELAIEANEIKDYETVNRNIQKVMKILNAFQDALDYEAGGELAETLYNMYYMAKRDLRDANLKKDSAKMISIKNVLEEILVAWSQIS